MSAIPDSMLSDLALARLLRLASPALPVGAYSYSQGLEYAIDRNWVHDERSALAWIRDVLELQIGGFDLPVLCRLQRAWSERDFAQVARWNKVFSAARESAELLAETRQMGYSLRALVLDDLALDPVSWAMLTRLEDPTFPAVFGCVAVAWTVPVRAALVAYTWSWAENQVMAALKCVPLGQSAGQRILAALSGELPDVVEAALAAGDDALCNSAPALALASACHETQYSRLFRS